MASELCWMTAAELAAAIRRKKLSPVEVVDATLERIEKLKALNAYVTVDADGARSARAAERADAPGRQARSAARGAVFSEGSDPHQRRAHDLRDAALSRQRPHPGCADRRAPEGRRRHHDRQDEHADVRLGRRYRQLAVRSDAQSVGSRAHARRLLRRRGGGSGRRAGPAGHRHRRRRLDPQAGGLLWDRRPQAVLWPLADPSPRDHLERVTPRPHDPHRPGCRADDERVPGPDDRDQYSLPADSVDYEGAARESQGAARRVQRHARLRAGRRPRGACGDRSCGARLQGLRLCGGRRRSQMVSPWEAGASSSSAGSPRGWRRSCPAARRSIPACCR